eukprot:scaffold23201_cov108-Isochrysis_galbana.AAC.1
MRADTARARECACRISTRWRRLHRAKRTGLIRSTLAGPRHASVRACSSVHWAGRLGSSAPPELATRDRSGLPVHRSMTPRSTPPTCKDGSRWSTAGVGRHMYGSRVEHGRRRPAHALHALITSSHGLKIARHCAPYLNHKQKKNL